MNTLIVDDDFTSRLLLQEILKVHGPTHMAVNGKEAIEALRVARESGNPYDLVCLDIMMPEMNGQEALQVLRADEEKAGILAGNGVKVVMTTALRDGDNIVESFTEACDAYLVKPIDRVKLLEELRKLELIS